jgi:ribose transport system permease protein
MAVEQNAQTPVESVLPKKTRASSLNMIRRVWPWAFLISMVVVFTISSKVMNNVDFISVRSVQGILTYATQILLIGLAETLIIITGGIDLSAGYMLGLAAVIGAQIMKFLYAAGVNPILTILAGMVGGTLVCIIPGFINGWLVAKVKVPAFIATLGMGYVIYGAALVRAKGYPVAEQPPYLGQIGNGFLYYFWPGHNSSFFKMPPGAVQSDLSSIVALVPNVVLITILVAIVIWFLLSKTQFGQHLYAVGGNYEAAKRAGIQVNSVIIKVFVTGAILCGIAGSLWATRFTSGDANAGVTTLLMGIAAVFIGGASMYGGEGRVIGTVIGALIIGTIQYGLVVLGISPFWQYFAVGVVVIVAVVMDQFGRTLER